jgi:hypothetical protein
MYYVGLDPLTSSWPRLRPNKRLKLTAPGLGRSCVCAPTNSVLASLCMAPAGCGAAA